MMRALLRDRSGSSATEFAMVLPLLLILLFGVIDGGRWMWANNQAEKATQMGARFAVVSNYVSSAIGQSYLGLCSPPLTQGDPIPADCFSKVTCTSSGCDSGTFDSAAFTAIYDRMHDHLPQLAQENVTVEYSPSGLGYAGNPYSIYDSDGNLVHQAADVAPLVTVKLSSLQFQPVVCLISLCSFPLPSAKTTLSSEDLAGSQSN